MPYNASEWVASGLPSDTQRDHFSFNALLLIMLPITHESDEFQFWFQPMPCHRQWFCDVFRKRLRWFNSIFVGCLCWPQTSYTFECVSVRETRLKSIFGRCVRTNACGYSPATQLKDWLVHTYKAKFPHFPMIISITLYRMEWRKSNEKRRGT